MDRRALAHGALGDLDGQQLIHADVEGFGCRSVDAGRGRAFVGCRARLAQANPLARRADVAAGRVDDAVARLCNRRLVLVHAGSGLQRRPLVCSTADAPSDRYLESGSYLRLSTLSLGYTFRNVFNGWIKDLQIYGTVNNVFTITGYKGVDPEINLGGLTPGMDWGSDRFPHNRTFLLGVKVNF